MEIVCPNRDSAEIDCTEVLLILPHRRRSATAPRTPKGSHSHCAEARWPRNLTQTQLDVAADRNPRHPPTSQLPRPKPSSLRSTQTRRSVPEKLPQLGEARIRRRSTESPRHRSARVPNAKANETSRSLPPQPIAAEATASQCPRRGIPSARHTCRRSDFAAFTASSPRHRSDASRLPHATRRSECRAIEPPLARRSE